MKNLSVAVFLFTFLLAFQIQASATAKNPYTSNATQVKCWGDNSFGQSDVPADLHPKDLSVEIEEVHMGQGYTCARNSLGSIQCWGRNGDSYVGYNFPAIEFLERLKNVSEFGIGMYGTCEIINGDVTCNGQFSKVPAGLKGAKSLTVGTSSACVALDKHVICWNSFDETPTLVPDLTMPTKVVASAYDVCTLDKISLKCYPGSRGDGFDFNPIPDLKNPRDFFSLEAHICALDDSGMKCWGKGLPGRPALPAVLPSAIPGAQYVAGRDHFCVLGSSQVNCYGDNSKGQTNVPALLHPKKIFSDRMSYQTCAVDDTGLVCWGDDSVGQVSLPAFSSISAGFGNTCIVDNGKPRCWGKGSPSINIPSSITDAFQSVVGSNFACIFNENRTSKNCWGDDMTINQTDIFSNAFDNAVLGPFLTAGYHHVCYYDQSGVKCVGANEFGETAAPPDVKLIQRENQLGAGGHHTCAIRDNGMVKCWGQNKFGQLDAPKNLKNPRFISTGFQHSCVIDDDGVKCWGRNKEGQLKVPPLENPTEVSAGGLHTCAVDAKGLHCWGSNDYGQINAPSGSHISHVSSASTPALK